MTNIHSVDGGAVRQAYYEGAKIAETVRGLGDAMTYISLQREICQLSGRRTWHPTQSYYEADNGLTSFISLACGLSSHFVTWVVWSSDCTTLL